MYGKNPMNDIHHDLIKVASYGMTDLVTLLLQNGANMPSYRDDALSYAANNNKIDTVKVLLNHGANVHIGDNQPLRWAAYNGHANMIKLLVEHGANVKEVLMRVKRYNYGTQVIKLLEQHL